MASEPDRIRLVVVDDHAVVRTGIAFALQRCPDIQLVGEAGSGEEALRLCAAVSPDVVLMDLVLPGGLDGVATIRALHAAQPQVRVLALTSFPEGTLVQETLQAGALGYLLKDMTMEDLLKAIRLAQHGVPSLAPAAAQALVHTVRTASATPPLGHDLTEREHEVLALLAAGLSNQQIAARLVITPATVKFHVRSIRSKLGASSRTETAVLAVQHHLVSDRDP
jgi:NarL family two-component system response regulator LiaR